MKCDKCNSDVNVQEHHIIPKCARGNGNLKDGMILWLCKKHHDILQFMLFDVIWDYVDNQNAAKEAIRNQTKWFVSKR